MHCALLHIQGVVGVHIVWPGISMSRCVVMFADVVAEIFLSRQVVELE